jgi:hypothetical protein
MVEKLNRTIEDRLKHTTNQACDDWDVWLPEALFAIRSTPASGTKMSPFRLLYRRDPILSIDNALLYPQPSSSMAQAEADRAITHAADHTRAASNMARYHSIMQEHLNASRTLHLFLRLTWFMHTNRMLREANLLTPGEVLT